MIMGKTIGMKPAVMLLALSIWGSLLGIAGMIIALPLTTVMISYYKRFLMKQIQEAQVVQEEENIPVSPPDTPQEEA